MGASPAPPSLGCAPVTGLSALRGGPETGRATPAPGICCMSRSLTGWQCSRALSSAQGCKSRPFSPPQPSLPSTGYQSFPAPPWARDPGGPMTVSNRQAQRLAVGRAGDPCRATCGRQRKGGPSVQGSGYPGSRHLCGGSTAGG